MAGKLDTRAIGLDAGLHFIRWLTGAENLHYGLWTGLEVTAGNLRAAQDAYTDLLFSFLPEGRLRILDIGGGAGETARKLLALGHEVEIVVPSAILAARCRQNAPGARVHECRFEDFEGTGPFDLCLFSESFQYVALNQGLRRALSLLDDGGEILIADCFRTERYRERSGGAVVGGGHLWSKFEAELARHPLRLVQERDITADVAPSVELEQGLFNVIGHVLSQLDAELAGKKPALRWGLHRVLRLLVNARRRERLRVRLMEQTRNAPTFCAYNSYRILRLARVAR